MSERDPVGVLYLSTGLVLLLGRYISTAPHRHFSASVTVSLENPIRYRTIGGRWVETRGLVAQPNAGFELDTGHELVMNLQIDPEKADAAALESLPFGKCEVVPFPDHEIDELVSSLRAMAQAPRVNGHAMRNATVYALCKGRPMRPRGFDPRIARVLTLLKQTFPDAPTSGELAAQVGLSEGRLIHLFGEQLGVPLRRYVLALRLRHVLFGLAMGHNLTDSAHEAGFCDSAHFTRVYREMYGLPPSKILRSDTVRIRFQAPDSEAPRSPHAEQDGPLLQRIEQSRVARITRLPLSASSRVARPNVR